MARFKHIGALWASLLHALDPAPQAPGPRLAPAPAPLPRGQPEPGMSPPPSGKSQMPRNTKTQSSVPGKLTAARAAGKELRSQHGNWGFMFMRERERLEEPLRHSDALHASWLGDYLYPEAPFYHTHDGVKSRACKLCRWYGFKTSAATSATCVAHPKQRLLYQDLLTGTRVCRPFSADYGGS